MHAWTKKEAPALKSLLLHSEAAYSSMSTAPLTNFSEDVPCGWKPTRPRGEYDITRGNKRQRRPLGSIPNLQPLTNQTVSRHGVEHPYMSGELDEDYSYSYRGGLSSKAYGSPTHQLTMKFPLPPPPPPPHLPPPPMVPTQSFLLDPVLPYRGSVNMDPSTRSQLEQIVALQLKPELLVERLIIENRLRTMSLNAFPVLEGIGVDGKRDRFRQKMPDKSASTPAIHLHNDVVPPPHHRKHKRRKPKPRPPMQWCALSNPPGPGARGAGKPQDFPALVLPFDSNKKQRQGFQGLGSVTSLSKLLASKSKNKPPSLREKQTTRGNVATGGTSSGQVQYALPVVAPELGNGDVKVKRSKLKAVTLPQSNLYSTSGAD